MREVLAAVLVVGAAAFALIAGIALLRFRDTFTRLHAATKPAVLGLVLAVLGAALRQDDLGSVGPLLLVAAFQVLTAPLVGHVVARAAHSRGEPDADDLVVDDLADRRASTAGPDD